MKPVVVFTVCRRYLELAAALERLAELSGEFAEKPDVVVVWARPEVGRLWFFQDLLSRGVVTKLLTRPPVPGEGDGRPTTGPESQNIRLGLEWVRANYDPASAYAIVQSADVLPNPKNGYAFFDQNMSSGAGAVVLHWENGCTNSGVWHTNFFAARLDEAYWPPVSPPDHADVLEAQYGKKLAREKPPGVVQSHNFRSKRFAHCHRSESSAAWPVIPQDGGVSTPLLISGFVPWWRRVLERLRLVRPFRRTAD